MPSKSSYFVTFVHRLFCGGDPIEQACDLGAMEERLRFFKSQFKDWSFCRRIIELKLEKDLDRSYLEVRDDLIQKMAKLKRESKAAIDEQVEQIEHMNEVVARLETSRDEKIAAMDEAEQVATGNVQDRETLREELCEIGEELAFRENVRTVLMELAQSKFPELTQWEEDLLVLEKSKESLLKEVIQLAREMGVDTQKALVLFHYTLNSGYFSYLSQEAWQLLQERCSEKELAWLKEHFQWNEVAQAFVLNDEQHYFSPLQQKQLVGSRPSAGISFLDYNLKKLLNEKLPEWTITRYENEIRSFYGLICRESLEDGILTVDEISMMSDLAEVLELDKRQAHSIINQEAMKTQKTFINENMALFHELAMADGKMHRDEANFLVEMKTKLEEETISNVSAILKEASQDGIMLKMNDEDFFVEMCRLAIQDKELDYREEEMLKGFMSKKGWAIESFGDYMSKAKAS